MPETDPSPGNRFSISPDRLPFLTVEPGIGGVLKRSPEDFFVDEIPAYEPCGDGEFLFVRIEKRGLSTPDLIRHIGRVLSLKESEIGCAGRKDTQAVTRQYVSIPARLSNDIDQINTDDVAVLNAARHSNKLKTGHLRGNSFRIVVRDAVADADQIAARIADDISRNGFPNYFGEQRFGAGGTTDEDGFRLLRGERTRRLSRDALRFTLSAAQSRLFNAWAAARIEDGLSQQVLPGDVMQVVTSRGPFVVTDPEIEQARYERHETVLSGPIFGPQMKQPQGIPAEREQRILDDFGISQEAFQRFRKLTSGTRRPLVIWPADLSIQPIDGGLEFRFTLPPGTYATCLLREFQKATHTRTDLPVV